MTRGINKIKNIFLTIIGFINRTHGLSLNGYTPFPFQVHVIQNLGLHLALRKKPCHLDDAVGKS